MFVAIVKICTFMVVSHFRSLMKPVVFEASLHTAMHMKDRKVLSLVAEKVPRKFEAILQINMANHLACNEGSV